MTMGQSCTSVWLSAYMHHGDRLLRPELCCAREHLPIVEHRQHYQRDVRRHLFTFQRLLPLMIHITFDLVFDFFDPFLPMLSGTVKGIQGELNILSQCFSFYFLFFYQ